VLKPLAFKPEAFCKRVKFIQRISDQVTPNGPPARYAHIIDVNRHEFQNLQNYFILCKMGWKFKSKNVIRSVAAQLKQRRIAQSLTLKNLEKITGIDCGQLSRFERADFKTASENLQKICKYFQISLPGAEPAEIPLSESVGLRFERFAALSPTHRDAAEDILRALEKLG